MSHVIPHFVFEGLAHADDVRVKSVQFFFPRVGQLYPEVVFSLLQVHPLVLFLEESADKIFGKETVFAPDFVIVLSFSLHNVVDGFRVIF